MDARLNGKPVLTVIVVSTREERVGGSVAAWFEDAARRHGAFDVRVADLKAIALPMLEEPEHPRLQKYTKESTKRWSAIVAASDAYVAVTPEYNYFAPPSLINALDHVYVEWNYKPIGFASYGGISGGTRSVQAAKQIATTLKMMPMFEQVTIPFVDTHIVEGRFTATDAHEKQAATLLDELLRWTGALRTLRSR